MANKTKNLIEEVNEVSRQLLSCILTVQNNSPPSPQDLIKGDIQSKHKDNEILTELMESRQKLITELFEKSTAKQISSESDILQVMISLDSELTTSAKLCKLALTDQVIKIKKSNKVIKSYQKY